MAKKKKSQNKHYQIISAPKSHFLNLIKHNKEWKKNQKN
jgi:hypothetical protein